ncbi:type II secretion system F family protein [Candidatus Pacearchaeota archaeon]|nr:type II secretion system F family protein [Candidatus Pacearchaeota archaeon]
MQLEKKHIVGIIAALVIIAISLIFLRKDKLFYFFIGIAVISGVLPFILSMITESKEEKENNEMFLEFSRNLVESVKAGTPISKSIINIKNKNYGTLTPHIHKLANQIALGIPVKEALQNFASDVNSGTVTRAVMLISEAEKAGGEIESILDSVAKSVSEIEKLKKERRAAIYALVVQGYIIFMIFIIIMLVLEIKVLPIAGELGGGLGMGDSSFFGGGSVAGESFDIKELSKPFLILILTQGLFSGLIIGKLAEGNIKAGIKHSFILMALAFMINEGVKIFFT